METVFIPLREEVLNVVRLMGKGGGYIAAPEQEIQGDVPRENILALLDAVKELYRSF